MFSRDKRSPSKFIYTFYKKLSLLVDCLASKSVRAKQLILAEMHNATLIFQLKEEFSVSLLRLYGVYVNVNKFYKHKLDFYHIFSSKLLNITTNI